MRRQPPLRRRWSELQPPVVDAALLVLPPSFSLPATKERLDRRDVDVRSDGESDNGVDPGALTADAQGVEEFENPRLVTRQLASGEWNYPDRVVAAPLEDLDEPRPLVVASSGSSDDVSIGNTAREPRHIVEAVLVRTEGHRPHTLTTDRWPPLIVHFEREHDVYKFGFLRLGSWTVTPAAQHSPSLSAMPVVVVACSRLACVAPKNDQARPSTPLPSSA
jgi:hypothetical protein